MVRMKKNDTNVRNVFLRCVCGAACTANRKSSSANQKASSTNQKASSDNHEVSSEDAEGFFQRALGSYTHKFPKHSAGSLTDLSELHLCLPELCLCLPSRVCNGKAEQQQKCFRKRTLFLRMRTL